MQLIADSNIVAFAVHALRAQGHDVVYIAERDADPGDQAILHEAHASNRALLTKDHDIGALVFRDGLPHAGVLLIDDRNCSSSSSQRAKATWSLGHLFG